MTNSESPFKPARSRRSKKTSRSAPATRSPEESPQAMLRDEIARLKEMAGTIEALAGENLSVAELVRILDVLGKTSTRIATLFKTERSLNEDGGGRDAFNQMLDDVIRELEKGEKNSGQKMGGGFH